MAKNPQLLLPADYVNDASKLIRKAVSRVSFLSMIITDDTSTGKLIDTLADAAKRKIPVDVSADMYTYTELSGNFIPSHYYSKRVRSTTRMAKEFGSAGVHFHWLGRFGATTFSGRTHSKWCVVDDTTYAFGGVNVYKQGIENTDFMLKIQDKNLADKLVKEHRRIVLADQGRYSYRSHQFRIDYGNVLVDGGFLGDSIIYRRVCDLAGTAKDIVFVSQYCPTGKLSRLLKKSNSKLYFNPWQDAPGFSRAVIWLGMKLSKQTTLYNRSNYLHAKFIIFTMKDGSKIAITGSHNFVHGGVILGTREIALETHDPSIVKQLEQFIKEHVA